MTDEVKQMDEAAAEDAPASERLDRAREKFSQVASGVERRVKSLGEGAQRAREQVREKTDQASAAARERYDAAAEKVKVGYDRARKDIDKLSQDVNEYVKDNPGKSVLIAAGVGFVVGLLLRGRRD